ncbi:MAG TPA: ATP-binding protein [Anaeromyxobacter sp.]
MRVEASGDAHGEWDSDRLVQVVTNLVVNALKYGCRGTEVTVRVAGAGDAATLEVHNEGEPIPADLQAHLFEPYRRGEQDSGDRTSIGLGLYIAHEIVRAHGGSLAARSSASEGTTFTVRLPRARHT